jgi:hypothetical protein
MKTVGAILGAIGGISTILFIVEVVRADVPLIYHFTAEFWMYLAGLLFLGSIVCFLAGKNTYQD